MYEKCSSFPELEVKRPYPDRVWLAAIAFGMAQSQYLHLWSLSRVFLRLADFFRAFPFNCSQLGCLPESLRRGLIAEPDFN